MTETHSEPVSQKIVQRVAEAEDADPLDLEVPLYEAIEPDALDDLDTDCCESAFQLTFTYYGYTVTVQEGGSVTIHESQHTQKSGSQSASQVQ